MLILGIDTSARQGSVALLQSQGTLAGERPEGDLMTVEAALLGEGRSSELLMPAIDALLARHGVRPSAPKAGAPGTPEKQSLSLIAVACGPGSFTGLRVAVATAKGLSEAFAIPVVPVSVLEAVALVSSLTGRVVAAIDAQRGELFYGEYVIEPSQAGIGLGERVREGIAGFEEFIGVIQAGTPPRICTPDTSLAARLREAGVKVSEVRSPLAEDIARIAHRKYLAGERADVAALDANYLRRSDAEIVAARKPTA